MDLYHYSGLVSQTVVIQRGKHQLIHALSSAKVGVQAKAHAFRDEPLSYRFPPTPAIVIPHAFHERLHISPRGQIGRQVLRRHPTISFEVIE
jgi:hypothetical protein